MSRIYPYAGFWRRAIAFFIDSIVLSIPMGILTAALLIPQGMALVQVATQGGGLTPDVIMGLVVRFFSSFALIGLVAFVGGWLYYALMESGKKQATLGKMALGIKVTGTRGERISFARATGRFFAKIISSKPLYFGFYMAGFTKRRQALHDLIADTLVIDKKCQETAAEQPALPFSTGFCITSIVVTVAPAVLYTGTILLVMFSGFAASMAEAQQKAANPPAITQQVRP